MRHQTPFLQHGSHLARLKARLKARLRLRLELRLVGFGAPVLHKKMKSRQLFSDKKWI